MAIVWYKLDSVTSVSSFRCMVLILLCVSHVPFTPSVFSIRLTCDADMPCSWLMVIGLAPALCAATIAAFLGERVACRDSH